MLIGISVFMNMHAKRLMTKDNVKQKMKKMKAQVQFRDLQMCFLF